MIDELKNLSTLNIAVFGDLILDRYTYGDVNRISQEAPILILDAKYDDDRLGGAVNVANNIVKIGNNVTIFGVVGNDYYGPILSNMVRQSNINTYGIVIDESRRTTLKTRFVSESQQILRVDYEDFDIINNDIVNLVIDKLHDNNYDGIVVSDYSKGFITKELMDKINYYSINCDIPVFVDPKGNDYFKYKNSSVITPNKKEAQIATGVKICDDKSLYDAAKVLLDRLNLDVSIITLGSDGIYFLTNDGLSRRIKTMAKSVFDVTGAGDTVIAVFSCAYLNGWPVSDAIELANIAAGIVVEKFGTSTVTVDDIIERIKGK